MADDGFGIVDYTRDVSAIGDPFELSAEQKRKIAEKKRRRARERMAALLAQSANPSSDSLRRAIETLRSDPVGSSDGDTRMSDGLSLALGSSAHIEYVQERSGMDQFERERARLASIGFGVKSDMEAPGADEFHEERYEELSHQDTEREERFRELSEMSGQGQNRVHAARVVKGEQAKSIIDFARKRAAGTRGSADDEFVSKKLDRIMDGLVYDDSRSDIASEHGATESVLEHIANNDAELQL